MGRERESERGGVVWSCQQTKRFVFGEEFKVLMGVGQGGLVGESVGAKW